MGKGENGRLYSSRLSSEHELDSNLASITCKLLKVMHVIYLCLISVSLPVKNITIYDQVHIVNAQ